MVETAKSGIERIFMVLQSFMRMADMVRDSPTFIKPRENFCTALQKIEMAPMLLVILATDRDQPGFASLKAGMQQ